MKTRCFDALVNFSPRERIKSLNALLLIRKSYTFALFNFYEQIQKETSNQFFVRIQSRKPLLLKWKDKFEVRESKQKIILGGGIILNPFSEEARSNKIEKRLAFLQQLQGDEKAMLLALSQEKGIKGLREREIIDFSSLTRTSLLHLSQELEEEGKIKILSFSPLFILSQSSFEFLCQRILTFLARFHEKYPHVTGVSLERIKKRFSTHPKIISLALKYLSRGEKIIEMERKVALSDFKMALSPEEENILKDLEDMCFKGEFRSLSFEDLRKRFRLSSQRLNRLLSFLIEREKIVQGKDGFLLHSRWLDEIIRKIRNSGKRELTVGDFKEMTGLTRKYAIPLLELLDQMGITRRKGPSREIL